MIGIISSISFFSMFIHTFSDESVILSLWKVFSILGDGKRECMLVIIPLQSPRTNENTNIFLKIVHFFPFVSWRLSLNEVSQYAGLRRMLYQVRVNPVCTIIMRINTKIV